MFFYKIVVDATIPLETLEKIFVEIIDSFSTSKNKMFIGQDILQFCLLMLENERNKGKIIQHDQKYVYDRISQLFQLTKLFNFVKKDE